MSVMFKCLWEMLFFESKDTEVFKADRNKLFASNEEQIDNHTFILNMLHSNISVVYTYHCRGVFANFFFCGCHSLLIFVAKKATIKALNFNFYVHKAPSKVEE